MLQQGHSAIEHMAFIMDGNRRWARAQGLSLQDGYKQGADRLRSVVSWGIEHHISHMSFFAFGKENWARPRFEVELLWGTLVAEASNIQKELLSLDVAFTPIGDREHWPPAAREALLALEQATAHGTQARVALVLDYSGRWDIEQAVSRSATMQQPWQSLLKSVIFPDPQLLVRTGGEQRLSNFYLYNIAYAELFFLEPYWPDFSKEDFESVLALYDKRQRRFGQ